MPSESRIDHPAGHFDLLRDLKTPGCAVCRGANRSAWRYLDALLWEFVTDAVTRGQLRDSHGFCREHALMASSVADDQSGQLGMAILVEDFLTHTLGHVAAEQERSARRSDRAPARGAARARESRLGPDRACPACGAAGREADTYLGLLASQGPETEIGAAADTRLPSLCLPHLHLGLRIVEDSTAQARLCEMFSAGAEHVLRDVREFIRKRHWQHHDEVKTAEEGRAWNTAVWLLVGEPRRRPDRKQ